MRKVLRALGILSLLSTWSSWGAPLPVEFLVEQWVNANRLDYPIRFRFEGGLLPVGSDQSFSFEQTTYLMPDGTNRTDAMVGGQTITFVRNGEQRSIFLGKLRLRDNPDTPSLNAFSWIFPKSILELVTLLRSSGYLNEDEGSLILKYRDKKTNSTGMAAQSVALRNRLEIRPFGKAGVAMQLSRDSGAPLALDQVSLLPVGFTHANRRLEIGSVKEVTVSATRPPRYVPEVVHGFFDGAIVTLTMVSSDSPENLTQQWMNLAQLKKETQEGYHVSVSAQIQTMINYLLSIY